MANILITWGIWYIWSHVSLEFLQEWHDVIILDNLSKNPLTVLHEIETISWKKPKFYEVDIRNIQWMQQVFRENKIDAVIHLAGFKSVEESCRNPYEYYDVNINWTIRLLYTMSQFNVSKIVFSSSATVYDTISNVPPYIEEDKTSTVNPYGTTKLIVEQLLSDVAKHKFMNSVALRYFNPIWCHPSWLIGDNPKNPTNLLPLLFKAVTGEIEKIKIFGNDYETTDWSWVRDFIHVMDVARSHLHAYEYLNEFEAAQKNSDEHQQISWMNEVFNISTWEGTSVLELLTIVEQVTWRKVAHAIVDRRDWDVATSIWNPYKAKNILWWSSKYSIEKAVQDHRNFVQKHKEII